jgi:hypothetical protein
MVFFSVLVQDEVLVEKKTTIENNHLRLEEISNSPGSSRSLFPHRQKKNDRARQEKKLYIDAFVSC